MKRRDKHSMQLVLVFLLFFSMVLTACGGADAVTPGTSISEVAATETTKPSAEDASPSQATETVKLTAIFNYNNPMTKEPQEMPSIQEALRDTNVNIEWEIIRSGWDDRKSLVLASGDLPDMFFGNRTINMSDIMSNVDLFVELTPYIDNSVNIKKMFVEEPIMKGISTLPNGNIYSLPHRMPLRPDTFDGMYINKKWLDAGDLQYPPPWMSFMMHWCTFVMGIPMVMV